MKKKIALTLIAGKLAVSSTQAFSAEGGLGKTDSTPGVSLSEIGAPIEILTAPTDGGSKNGVLYTSLAANERIDFIINGVPHQGRELQVYLAYSNQDGKASQWTPFESGHGQIELDVQSLQVLAGILVTPAEMLSDFPESSLGSVNLDRQSILLPVSLSDLNDLGNDGQRIYFQAVVIPVGTDGGLLWEQGYATEVDSFLINRTLDHNPEYEQYSENGKNSESSGDDGKSSEPTDSGGK